MPDKSYTVHAEDIRSWLSTTYNAMLIEPETRDWCILDITKTLTPDNIDAYFPSTDVNKAFDVEAAKQVLTNVPVAHLQIEADQIYALAKSMQYRHQLRLRHYRDDIENKNVRTSTSIALSLAKLNMLTSLMKPGN